MEKNDNKNNRKIDEMIRNDLSDVNNIMYQ